jgi:RNA polymerase sigma factor (sigma-70 family)
MSEKIREGSRSDRPYDVFLSYAHEDRSKIKPIVVALSEAGIAVLDPLSNQREMWGRSLDRWFSEVFPASAKTAMVFLSKNYNKSSWCKRELEYVLNTARDNPSLIKVLPIRLDNSPVPQQASEIVFINLTDNSPEEIAELTKEKIKSVEDSSKSELALLSDEELIEKIGQERDQYAFSLLYKRIYPRILRYIKSYRSKELDKQNDIPIQIVSDVLLKVWEQASKFSQQEASFDHWIATLTAQSFLNMEFNRDDYFQARELLIPWGGKTSESDTSRNALSLYWNNPENIAQASQLMRDLYERLDNDEKQLIELYINGNSSTDIAEILGLTPTIVRFRMSRLIAKLRSRILHGELAVNG